MPTPTHRNHPKLPAKVLAKPLAKLPAKLTAILAFAATTCPTQSHAEEPGITATGKGITGGALLGSELVMAIEAAFGVQNSWAYVGGGAAGALAGAISGYYIEKSDNPTPSHYMLAGGLALIIPTTVVVLNATSYKAPDHYIPEHPEYDNWPDDEAPGPVTPTPTTNPPTDAQPDGQVDAQPEAKVDAGNDSHTRRTKGASARRRTATSIREDPTPTRLQIPMSLFDVSNGDLCLGVPGIQIRRMYSETEMLKFGVSQRTELRVPLFQARF